VGDELFNVERQTGMTRPVVVFRDFTKVYKKDSESKRRDGQTDRQTNGQIKRHIKHLKQDKLS
jgi:hypothetical protein